jgi:tetratricopeptide (TPR) repeat protein
MCYFGEAWAWGPYLNGPMNAAKAPRAHAAITKAVQLRDRTKPVERALIDAMALRYTPVHNATTRAGLDTAYSQAMLKVYEQYPADLDVGALYAESLMLLNRARGTYEIDQPHVQKFHKILDEVLTRDLHHPGACHLYIHATEATSRPTLAEQCALHLGSSIPGASHINHMPSHTFNRIGRWGDAVRANIDAWHTDVRAGNGEGIAIGPTHNLHMLLYAASYDGQGAVAIQASRDYGKLVRGGTHYIALTMIRFGRFAEVVELTEVPTNESFRAQWEFARGYAHLRLGAVDSARFYMSRIDSVLGGTGNARNNAPANITAAILRAELLLHDGKAAEAITQLEAAVERTDGMPYAEPELLPFSARHWLGAVLLQENRASDAERIYQEDLVHHPRNGWSLHGLLHAFNAQGKSAEAAQVQLRLNEAWARSDSWIRASRL